MALCTSAVCVLDQCGSKRAFNARRSVRISLEVRASRFRSSRVCALRAFFQFDWLVALRSPCMLEYISLLVDYSCSSRSNL